MKTLLALLVLIIGFNSQAANVENKEGKDKPVLTKEEQQTVDEAKAKFAEAKKSKKKPSKHMQSKMNSTFGEDKK